MRETPNQMAVKLHSYQKSSNVEVIEIKGKSLTYNINVHKKKLLTYV